MWQTALRHTRRGRWADMRDAVESVHLSVGPEALLQRFELLRRAETAARTISVAP